MHTHEDMRQHRGQATAYESAKTGQDSKRQCSNFPDRAPTTQLLAFILQAPISSIGSKVGTLYTGGSRSDDSLKKPCYT